MQDFPTQHSVLLSVMTYVSLNNVEQAGWAYTTLAKQKKDFFLFSKINSPLPTKYCDFERIHENLSFAIAVAVA